MRELAGHLGGDKVSGLEGERGNHDCEHGIRNVLLSAGLDDGCLRGIRTLWSDLDLAGSMISLLDDPHIIKRRDESFQIPIADHHRWEADDVSAARLERHSDPPQLFVLGRLDNALSTPHLHIHAFQSLRRTY